MSHDKTRRLIKYIVTEDCTLDYTNFEAGEEIEIPEEPDNNWKGVEWFDKYPQIFEPFYSKPLSTPQPVQSLNEGEWAKGEAEITKKENYQFPFRRTIRIGSLLLCEAEGKTVEIAEANAARIVYAWNNISRVEEQNEALTEALKLRMQQYDHVQQLANDYSNENRALKERMEAGLLLYNDQTASIVRLEESNRELLEALIQTTKDLEGMKKATNSSAVRILILKTVDKAKAAIQKHIK